MINYRTNLQQQSGVYKPNLLFAYAILLFDVLNLLFDYCSPPFLIFLEFYVLITKQKRGDTARPYKYPIKI